MRIPAKKASFAITVITSIIISVPVFIYDHLKLATPVTKLSRNSAGEGSRTVTLRAVTEDGTDETIRIDVDERQYPEQGIREFSRRVEEILWNSILGKNTDPENVMYDLDLCSRLDGFPFVISWKSDRPLILSSRGIIDTKRLSDEDKGNEGIRVRLCATLKYKDYSEDKYSYVVVRSINAVPEGSESDMIMRSIDEADEKTKESDYEVLPSEVSGKKITFYDASTNRGWAVVFFGIMVSFIINASRKRRKKDESEKRVKQTDSDYPNIVSQYILYYTAGMNPRAIWSAMCSRYEENLRCGITGRRYAYEEMMITRRLMDEGCEELSAYDQFASRLQNEKYRSFIGLVKQTVVKGGEGLENLLYDEMDKAMQKKNDQIRIKAAEAETKLLLPMFMMLLIVLVIVMIPAFIGLNA